MKTQDFRICGEYIVWLENRNRLHCYRPRDGYVFRGEVENGIGFVVSPLVPLPTYVVNLLRECLELQEIE